MTLNRELMREAGSFAYHELKKMKLYQIKVDGAITVVSLFGDNYQFFFDKERKISWVESKQNYKNSSTYRLHTAHKDWDGILSFPRSFVHEKMMNYLKEKDYKIDNSDFKSFVKETKIVAQQAYSADKKKIARMFGCILWKNYDREIACLAMKVYGIGATSLDYSIIANNKEEFCDTIQKAPGILPVWNNIILNKMIAARKNVSVKKVIKSSFSDLFFEDDFQETEESFNYESQNVDFSNFNYPRDAQTFVYPDIIKTTKTYLESKLLTKSGWKYLVKLPSRFAKSILVCSGMNDFVSNINWLAYVGVIPRYSLIKKFMQSIAYHSRTEDYSIMIRCGLNRVSKMKSGVRDFIEREMSLVFDWFIRGGRYRAGELTYDGDRYVAVSHVELDENQKKVGWDWFMRQQETWHQESRAIDAARNQAEVDRLKKNTALTTWFSYLGEFEYKGYNVVPLTDSHALLDEGREMKHCVGNYSHDCLRDVSRIFSIRQKDLKIATLEITKNLATSTWKVNQCRGIKNEDVSLAIKKVSEEVVKRYNKAVKKAEKIESIAV